MTTSPFLTAQLPRLPAAESVGTLMHAPGRVGRLAVVMRGGSPCAHDEFHRAGGEDEWMRSDPSTTR